MKKDDIAKKILLAAGGISPTEDVMAFVGIDNALQSLGLWYKNQDRRSRYRIRKVFAELKKSGLIERSDSEDAIKVSLTEEGKKRMSWHQLQNMRPPRPKKWDRKWRVVIFDIPETFKSARNILRKKLKEFGFITLQRSIWIYPYECRNEINFLTEFLGVKQYINLIEAVRIDGEEKLKERFHLKM